MSNLLLLSNSEEGETNNQKLKVFYSKLRNKSQRRGNKNLGLRNFLQPRKQENVLTNKGFDYRSITNYHHETVILSWVTIS